MACVRETKITIKLEATILEKQDDGSWQKVNTFWLGGTAESVERTLHGELLQQWDRDEFLVREFSTVREHYTDIAIRSIHFSSGACGEIRIASRGPCPIVTE